MTHFTFIAQDEAMPFSDGVSSKRTLEFSAESLDQILNQFEDFLRGCGFTIDGLIDVVRYDDVEENEEESKWDFSAIPQNNFPFSTVAEDIKLDFGAAQPALNFDFSDSYDGETISIDLSGSTERCPICKIPKSVMKSEKCYDSACPKTSWLNDLDYKLASEK